MKRIKVTIMALAILLSIGGAFASKPDDGCVNAPQYKKVGSSYVPCGIFGYNFDCTMPVGSSCTYWFNTATNQYEVCHTGTYEFIQ